VGSKGGLTSLSQSGRVEALALQATASASAPPVS
jgi:hypothetical protein